VLNSVVPADVSDTGCADKRALPLALYGQGDAMKDCSSDSRVLASGEQWA
jgi:hypothetical protein